MKKILVSVVLLLATSTASHAQRWMQIHKTDQKVHWTIPFEVNGTSYFDIAGKQLRGHVINKEESEIVVPYSIAAIDSITVVENLSDSLKGHNRYKCFAMYIDTENQEPISVKENWLNCHISVDGMGEYSNFSGTGRIRGRGNSSWEWYDKKPYKFKLDQRSKLLGLDKAKDWNLMANYRDVTDMMNAVAFETARYMGMPNTNHTRFVEVYLNGSYIGLYQLTEKVEVDDNRVNIDHEEGIMLSFDQDDGPSLSPEATNNFYSAVFKLPMSVKYPDEPTAEQLQKAKEDFAVLETAISKADYHTVDSLLDIPSYISILQLHEYLYNVEIDAPRSIYMYRDKGGKYVFGPVWDWDAGFDFDWGDMYTGHTFFSDYRELIYGTDPYNAVGANYNVSEFWRDMFYNAEFVKQYKEQWNNVKDSLYLKPWSTCQQWVDELNKGAYTRDITRWPLSGKSVSTEVDKMKQWLQNRLSYLNTVIPNYPEGTDQPVGDFEVVKTLNISQTCYYSDGYSQDGHISIDKNTVKNALGAAHTSDLTMTALNSDGTKGENTAAGTYGAWFDANGDTNQWGVSHIFIEINSDLWNWNYGCHPDNCQSGDTHTVTMQYRYNNKAVNVEVTFNIQ